MTSDNLYKKIENVIQDHIREHKKEVSLGKRLLQKLDIDHLNRKVISQDYSFNLNATSEKMPVNESLELTKARIEANSSWNDGWTKQYYADRVKELEGKSKYYYDYDRNDPNRKNPFLEEPDLDLEQIRQKGGFEWTPGNY
jgi:hypothetical protein|tara:strand:- start:1263 stop:1685 length:423 start_codon:yes stop_codon:yes gene_type:complete